MSDHNPYGPYERLVKRPLDFLLALIAIIVLFIPMLIVALLVRINLGSPVVFSQNRPGRFERIFRMYKFRSMTNQKDSEGKLLPDMKRLTKFGKILRATSLDELPELINILKGDMSFIGPRPLSVLYLPFYTEDEHHRHDVRPGLTGLAQINGRNSISWEQKFEKDLQYVSHITFLEDIKIFIQTILVVFQHKDIGQAEQAPISLHILRGEPNHGN